MSQLLRVQNFCVSMDGFGAGEGQSLEAPFGHAERRGGSVARLPADLASWAFATASWPNRTEPGGSRGLDDYFIRDFSRNIGAEIMGRNKFGPQRGSWEDLEWTGWWGDTPPFHTPVFVLTHHPRPSFTLADTTFHFLDATPAAPAGSTTTSPAISPTTSAPRSWAATSSGHSAVHGRTTSGRDGGATSRRSTRRCSS